MKSNIGEFARIIEGDYKGEIVTIIQESRKTMLIYMKRLNKVMIIYKSKLTLNIHEGCS